jgi:hypothetical protein
MATRTVEEGFEAVDGTWQFDLQFYREVGLNLAPLEDPSPDALMPRLRRAATIYSNLGDAATANHVERAEHLLQRVHGEVGEELWRSRAGLNLTEVTPDHPAVVSYVNRTPSYEQRNTEYKRRYIGYEGSLARQMLDHIERIHVGLLRPKMPAVDPRHVLDSKATFIPVNNPNSNFYTSPLQVASQLTLARVGVWFDI